MNTPKHSNSAFDYFSKLRKSIAARMIYPYSFEKDSLYRWRAVILSSILIGGLVFGVFAFIAAAILILKENAWGLASVDILGLILCLILLSVHRIRFEIRSSITLLGFYMIGVAVILAVGPLSGGPAWLFAFAVLAGVLMGNYAAFFAILMNAVFISTIGLLIWTGKFGGDFPFFNTPQAMIAAGVNFIVLNAVTAVSVSALVKGLFHIFKEKDDLANRFEEEKIQLIETKQSLESEIKDRKQTEKALLKSETKYRRIYDNVLNVYYESNLDGVILEISPSIEKHSQYKRKELIGKSLYDIYANPEDRKKLIEIIINEGRVKDYEIILTDKDGTEHICAMNIELIKDDKNNPIKLVGIFRDITEQKLAEEALTSERNRIASILEGTNAGTWDWYVQTGEVTLNQRWAEIMGRTLEDLEPIDINTWIDNIHPDDLPGAKAMLTRHFSGETDYYDVLFRQPHKRGDWVWVNARGKVVEWSEDGKPLRMSGTHLDITERKQIEEELRISEERYREYFEENISGTYISTPEGLLITCNQEYRRIFGFDSIKHALEKPINNFFKNPNERADFLNMLKKEKRVTGYEPKLTRLDGTHIHLIENASGVFDKDGNLRHIRGFLLDVTEQKKLETQLRQAQKMEAIGTLAGGIAHDFNNILFPIIGYSEMLIEDIPENSPLQAGLNEINTAALRAKDLVKQILTFSHKDNSELNLMKMQPVINEALKLIRSTIPTTIEIIKDIDPACGAIKADPTQIHQIIMNLATNAYHAMGENDGEMKINLKEVKHEEPDLFSPEITPGTYACLSIADTGKGMDNELIEKIFDPFFTTKEMGKGTGMGLSVVHGIVKNMKGVIKVYSEPGKGTEFKVYLPLAADVKEHQVTHTTKLIQNGTEHILLVDDENSVAKVEKRMLGSLGYQVTVRTSSIEALEAFSALSGKFDMVITDMQMPNMSGDKLAVELIKIRPDIPILLCTGFSENMSEEKAVSLGIKGFLLKPILMDELSRKIREVLDNNKIEIKN